MDTKVSILLDGTITDEDDNDVIAEQLSKISEQMAIKNRRNKRIWKIVGIVMLSFLFLNILLTIFAMWAYRTFFTEGRTPDIETNEYEMLIETS